MKKHQLFGLITGLIFVFIGIVNFSITKNYFNVTIMMCSITMIFAGIVEFFILRRTKTSNLNISTSWAVILGIFQIFIGIVLLINIDNGYSFSFYVIAIWSIGVSLINILEMLPVKKQSKLKYELTLLLSIIGCTMGFIVLFNPLISITITLTIIKSYLIVFGLNVIWNTIIK